MPRGNPPNDTNPQVAAAAHALVEAVRVTGKFTYQVTVNLESDDKGNLIEARIEIEDSLGSFTEVDGTQGAGQSGVFALFNTEEDNCEL